MVLTERKTKEERREEILDAALAEFAEHGPPRRLDRRDRPPRGHLAAVRLPALRDEEGAVSGRRRALLPPDARALPAGGRGQAGRGGAARRSARPTASCSPPTASTCAPRCRPMPPARTRRSARSSATATATSSRYVERVSGLGSEESRASSPRDADERARLDARDAAEEWGRRLLEGCKDGQ